jgi:hypothetical protein
LIEMTRKRIQAHHCKKHEENLIKCKNAVVNNLENAENWYKYTYSLLWTVVCNYYSLVYFKLMHVSDGRRNFYCVIGTAEYLKLNPLGYVPVLVDGDIVVADSLDIILVCFFVDVLCVICYVTSSLLNPLAI